MFHQLQKSIYSEAIFKKALTREDGVEIEEKCISNIHYADNTVLISDSLGGLQNMSLRVASVGLEYGLEINITKTK